MMEPFRRSLELQVVLGGLEKTDSSEAVLSYQALALHASELKVLVQVSASAVDFADHLAVVPCCQSQAYQGEVAIRHLLLLVEVCALYL